MKLPRPTLPKIPKAVRYGAAGCGVVLIAGVGFGTWLCMTDGGHDTAARLIRDLSDNEVQIDGLSGDMLHRISARQIRIADTKGVYLTMDTPDLKWNAWSLIRNRVEIYALTADRITMTRAPEPSRKKSSRGGPQIRIAKLNVRRIDISKAAYGQEAHLSLTGSLHYVDAKNLGANMFAQQLNGSGSYRANLRLKKGWPEGYVRIRETGHGFAGALAGMPDLGSVQLDLNAKTRGAKDAITLHLQAGALKAEASGQVDLAQKILQLKFTAVSPEMHPRKDLSWGAMQADGTAGGSFTHPKISAHLSVDALTHGTTQIARTQIALTTQDQRLQLAGSINGLNVPGDDVKALAGAPIELRAEADFADAKIPLTFTVSHPLLQLRGNGTLKQTEIQADLDLPHLSPLTKLAGAEVNGHAKLHLDLTHSASGENITLDGRIAAGGKTLADKIIGPDGRISAKITAFDSQQYITADLNGRALSANVKGNSHDGAMDYQAKVAIKNASYFSPQLAGSAALYATLTGPNDGLLLKLHGDGIIGAKATPRDHMSIRLTADHLATAPQADIRLNGAFADSPVDFAAHIGQTRGQTRLQIRNASWRSATLSGALTLGKNLPLGDMHLQLTNLDDLSEFAGTPLQGTLDLQLQSGKPGGTLMLRSTLKNFAAKDIKIGEVTLNGKLLQAKKTRTLDAELHTKDLSAQNMRGTVDIGVSGPLTNLVSTVQAQLHTAAGQFALNSKLQLDTKTTDLRFDSLDARWNGKTIALAEPAEFRKSAAGLQTSLILTDHASTRITLKGRIPQKPDQSFALDLTGQADMAKWADALTAQGRTLAGQAKLDFRVTGTQAAPNITGSAKLTNGRFYDVTTGLRLHDIRADVAASGSEIILKQFSAKAHGGTLTGTGTITTTGKFPVDLEFRAKDARPFSRDGFKIDLDGNITLKGMLKGDLQVGGKLKIDKGEIRLPDKMPPTIATLDVRRPGDTQQTGENAQPPSRIAINLTISSPGQFFIRGHGLEAELAGQIRIDGTTAKPQLHGKLDMRRGTYSMAGTSLNFTSGNIDFEGSNSSGDIDPALDFTATSETSSVTATLNITGTAKHPKITLTSSPSMPQDEILSQLLFQQSMDELSPLQLAQIAQALVALSGLDGGINPVEIARSSLKLDRLQVSSSSTDSDNDTSGTTIEAGKYVLHNVYVGAKQSLSGGTRAQVQVDINRHFKLEGSVATDTGSSAVPTTQTQDTGDTVGLSYQFEY